jgi:predicted MFS family arabinose efflux permease
VLVSRPPSPAAVRSGLIVVALCFLTIVFDGYDLIVYGSAVPSLLAEPGWNTGPAQVGAIEYAPRGRRQLYNALMFAGYPVGGVIAAVLALLLLADHGWRPLLAIGAAPLVIVLPPAWQFLPESRRIGTDEEETTA